MKAILRAAGYIVLGWVILAAVGAIAIYSGAYNIATEYPHTKLVHESVEALMINSVRSHARGVAVPAGVDLHDRKLARNAAELFASMCVMCHGAPGREPDRWSRSLYPAPPDLVEALREHDWTDQEVFWIVKHGVKDTGMAGFGGSDGDRELWGLTALVRQLGGISASEYRAMVQSAGGSEAAEPKGQSSHEQSSASREH